MRGRFPAPLTPNNPTNRTMKTQTKIDDLKKPLRLGWNQARITVALSLLLVVTALAVLIYTLAEVLP